MSTTIRKINSFRHKSSAERVPVLPIHDKYAERHHELIEDPFDDIIGKIITKLMHFQEDIFLHDII